MPNTFAVHTNDIGLFRKASRTAKQRVYCNVTGYGVIVKK
jgi:hypothetical protein